MEEDSVFMGVRALLRELRPLVLEGEFVFAVTDLDVGDLFMATVREAEGRTVILRRSEAAKLSLSYTFPSRWITLQVQSELNAVGLTAVLSRALADKQISCNVIAGNYHDHLLVPSDRCIDAMAVLKELAHRAGAQGPHQVLSTSPSERVICCGDIHGCFEELRLLLTKINYRHGEDVLVSVGDLVNKGPQSAEVLDFFMTTPKTFAVAGNHDLHCVKKFLGPPTELSSPAAETWLPNARQAAYLASLPLTLSLPDLGVIVVHAGLEEDVSSLQQMSEAALTTMRIGKDGKLWAQSYAGAHGFAVFGHDAKQGLQAGNTHALGLDTGCVYGRELTCVVLPSKELVSVPASRVYRKPGE